MWAEIKSMNQIIPQKIIISSNIDLSDRMNFSRPEDQKYMFSGERKVPLSKNLREILKGNIVPEIKPLMPTSVANKMKHTTL